MTISVSGDRLFWRLRMGRSRSLLNHRQLQHGHALPFTELRHEHIVSIGKFDRIMMTMRKLRVHPAELSYPEIDGAGPDPSVVVFDILGERELGPRQHADRYRGLVL